MPIPQNDGRKTAHQDIPAVIITDAIRQDARVESEEVSQTKLPGLKIKIRFGKNGWGGKVQGGTTSSLPEEAGLRSQGNDVGTMANPAINDSAAFPAIDDSAACPPATFPAVKPRRKHNRTIAAKPPVAKPAIDDSAAFPAINDSASCPPATFPTVKPRRKCNRTITAKPQNKRIRPTKQPMSQDDSNSTLPATFPAVKARIKPASRNTCFKAGLGE
ncbi:hypothetical protein PtB15_15B481 [Puccinia triticina]|nr:hypothetical protein PtB15_15B481 [Puccinia triticina]